MDSSELESLRTAARQAFDGTPVFLAYIHGSRVAGGARDDSDLDIGYYARPAEGDGLTVAAELELEDRLSRATGLDVDLRDLGRAPLEVRGRILEQGIRLYCADEVARVRLESGLLSLYHDYKEELEQLHAERLHTIARQAVKRP